MRKKTQTVLFAQERRNGILKELNDNSKIHVLTLSEIFKVSPVTIRADLRILETQGKLRRTHGGALSADKTTYEPYTSEKEEQSVSLKKNIAAAALTLIDDYDAIALDTGTTTMELAKLLVDKKSLTVVTNDLPIALFLENNSDATIILTGGTIRRGFHCTVGHFAINSLMQLHIDKAFLASNAFSTEFGFSTPNEGQSEIKKVYMSISSKTIMLMDSTKLNRDSLFKFADMSKINTFITNSEYEPDTINKIRETWPQTNIILA